MAAIAFPLSLSLLPVPIPPTDAHAGSPAAFTSHLLAPDPEWQAMRGARAATGPGLAASIGNPAAVASLSGGAGACSHLQWAEGLTREWAGAGWAVGRGLVVAFDAAVLRGPELQGFDADGNSTIPFRASEWSVASHAALPVGRGVEVGIGARHFRLEDEAELLSGTGFSLGIQVHGASRTVGLAVTDVGAPMNGPHGEYALPTFWRAGFEQATAGERMLLAASVEGGASGKPQGALGVVLRPLASLDLLGGLIVRQSAAGESPMGWSAGATVHRGPFSVSYALRQEEALGATHIVGMRVGLHGLRDASRSPRPDGPKVLPFAATVECPVAPAGRTAPAAPAWSPAESTVPPDPADAPQASTMPPESVASTVSQGPLWPVGSAPPNASQGPATILETAPTTITTPRYAVFGSRYRSADAAEPELALIRREGFPAAVSVPSAGGGWRVLVVETSTAREADAAVARLRGRAIVVKAEALQPPILQAVSPASH